MWGDELAAMVDDAGGPYEETAAYLERLAARFSEETSAVFTVQHFPIEEPEGAVAYEVEAWPDGTPCVIWTHWSEREPED
jgi:hypothetical protein